MTRRDAAERRMARQQAERRGELVRADVALLCSGLLTEEEARSVEGWMLSNVQLAHYWAVVVLVGSEAGA